MKHETESGRFAYLYQRGRSWPHEDADNKKVAFRAAKKIADDFGTDYGGNGKIQFVCNGTGVSRV